MLAMCNKTIEPLTQEKNDAVVKGVQGLVVGLVSAEVARVETKVEGFDSETEVDSGYVDVNKDRRCQYDSRSH